MCVLPVQEQLTMRFSMVTAAVELQSMQPITYIKSSHRNFLRVINYGRQTNRSPPPNQTSKGMYDRKTHFYYALIFYRCCRCLLLSISLICFDLKQFLKSSLKVCVSIGSDDIEKEIRRCFVESFRKLDEDFLCEAKRK